MISVNIHAAKSNLSKLVGQVENFHEIVQLCRNGKPIAQIVPLDEALDPLLQHHEIQAIKFYYNPVEPLAEDEWPTEK